MGTKPNAGCIWCGFRQRSHLACDTAGTAHPAPTRRLLIEAGAAGLFAALAGSLGSPAPLRAQPATGAATGQGRMLLRGGTVLTMDPALGDLPRGDVLIEAGRIAAVRPGIEAAGAEAIDASDMILIPGFVDTHRHMWQGIVRNVMPDGSLMDYLQAVLGRIGPVYRPEDVYAGNLLSALGALEAGVTTVLDWSHVQNTPAHADAAIQALRDAGLRAVFAYGQPQNGRGWWESEGHAYPGDIARLRRQYFNSDDQFLTLALAAWGPNFGPVEAAAREWRAAREAGARISTHVGVGPDAPGSLAPLGRMGLLRDDTTYIHCCYMSDEEWRMVADSGGTVSIAPQIELQMGHGDPPVQRALDAGIRPSLSIDVETSVPSDMFTQMRAAIASQRGLAFQRAHRREPNPPASLTAREALAFATIEGARANGLASRIGSLTPGKQADVVLLRKDRLNVMPVTDPVGAVVLGMDTSNVDTVLVGGEVRKRDGRLVGVDMRRVAALAAASQEHVLSRAAIR